MTTPVTATVSEPVRAKRPTLYGHLYPSELAEAMQGRAARIRLWTDPDPVRSRSEKPVPGSVAIVIPGEGDDAPSGWRPASEPPSNYWNVAVRVREYPSTAIGWRCTNGEWQVVLASGVVLQDAENIEAWHELPTPPGATQ